MRYVFLSIRPKPLVRTFLAGIFLVLLLHFLLKFPVWLVPVLVAAVHLVYLLARIGIVTVVAGEPLRIEARTLFHAATIRAPFHCQRWWSYVFNEGGDDTESGKEVSGGTAPNDLDVYLKLRDATGKELVFTEYIGFDTRFPNECPYSTQSTEPEQVVFRVQRTDKLFQFLEKNIPAKDFVLELK